MPTVLIVEDEPLLSTLLNELLTDAGYQIMTLLEVDAGAVQTDVERIPPDCVLLDSSGRSEYGASWDTAAWLRTRSVPTVMMTGHQRSAAEALEGLTSRSQAAAFAAVLIKPFELDALGAVVARAMARPNPA
jgi:DNA-binding response OmpR family regulator